MKLFVQNYNYKVFIYSSVPIPAWKVSFVIIAGFVSAACAFLARLALCIASPVVTAPIITPITSAPGIASNIPPAASPPASSAAVLATVPTAFSLQFLLN